MLKRIINKGHKTLPSGEYVEYYSYAYTKKSCSYGTVYERYQLEIPFNYEEESD